MVRVNAGELNRRIQIIQVSQVKDSDGYSVPKEELVHACWCRVTRTSGTELVKANSDFGEEKVRFLIRWTSKPIDRKQLVRFEGKDYQIEYINDYGRPGYYMEIWGVWRSREGG